MSGNYRKEDLRIIKTHRALKNALMTLLETKKFKNITVNDICAEALTSRAAFYSHFCDKYALLNYIFEDNIKDKFSYEEFDQIITNFIYKKNKVLKNLLADADSDTLDVLHRFLLKVIERGIGLGKVKPSPEYIVRSNFCIGGILQVLNWQIKNYYPEELEQTKKCFHEIIRSIAEWDYKA